LRVLLVVLNKDNAEGLRECLKSLTQQSCGLCGCFDVLVMDGGSRDGSRDVVAEFSSKYPCIRFKVQEVGGGVGPARVEAVRYALDYGYDYVIWGDSENVYDPHYVEEVVKRLGSPGCDVVSGRPVVAGRSFWSRAFFWYHAYHVLFDYVRRRHAPGNNKGVSVGVYSRVIYPPVSRSDDFYFSYLALSRGLRFCYAGDAVVKVSMPEGFKGVRSWQNSRVRGLVEGALILGMHVPPDYPPWLLLALSPLAVGLAAYLAMHASPIAPAVLVIAYLAVLAYLGYKLFSAAGKALEGASPRLTSSLTALLGMYLHSVFTTYYVLKHLRTLYRLRGSLASRAAAVLRRFGFRPRDAGLQDSM